MPKEELCWQCKGTKTGVKLCAEDRLCPDCDRANEIGLAALRNMDSNAPACLPAVPAVGVPKAKRTEKSQDDVVVGPVKPAAKDTRTRSAKTSEKSNENANPSHQIAELREVIASQNDIIKSLSDKLNFVLSYLEIDNSVTSTMQPEGSQDSLPNTGELPGPHTTYASITARLAANSVPCRTTAVLSKEDAVAAVYVDIAKKTQRESNIIVSGIQPSLTQTDTQLVYNLCSSELDTQLDILHVKRLGREAAGKTQPLLVVLRDADEAKSLIRNARFLRHSTNPDVKNKVYINPNLTPAEAAAAYQLRVQRRLSAQRRRDNGGPDDELQRGSLPSRHQVNTGSTSSTPVINLETSVTLPSVGLNKSMNNQLNVSAPNFVPPSGRLGKS
jgi:hypothetical protein